MARFEKYGVNDSIANAYIEALKDNSPFHFTLVGMARLMSLYEKAPAIQKNKILLLQKVFERSDSHNAWTSEGTENHINMARTSGYLFAQHALDYPELFPEAAIRMQQMKDWMKYWSKRIYEVGVGEWHSGIYETYNIIGWLNVYDFAKDNDVKAIAKAVLDYYAAEIALFYSYGIPGGSEMRGSGITKSTHNATNYLAWLWFGPTNDFPFQLRGNQYIQSMHAVTSTYHPEPIMVQLAQKELEKPAYYLNSKPSYLLANPSYVKQPFYIGRHFTLGSQVSRYGGWTGASYQIINWKLVAESDKEGVPDEISGNGLFWENYLGKTRDPWTQYMQHENVMIQLTRVPENAEEIYYEIEKTALEWNEQWKQDFLTRYPSDRDKNVYHKPEKVNYINKSFLNLPDHISCEMTDHVITGRMNKLYLAIYPVNRGMEIDKNKIQNRLILEDNAKRDDICGFVVEVFDQEEFADYDSFKSKVNSEKRLRINETVITYHRLNGDQLKVSFENEGTFEEPLYDWGYGTHERHIKITSPPFHGPEWPEGKNFGRIPTFLVNNKKIDHETQWAVFEGPNLSLVGGVLELTDNESSYIVDYTGEIPVFK